MKHTFRFLLAFLFMGLSCSVPKSASVYNPNLPPDKVPYKGYGAIAHSIWEKDDKTIKVEFGAGGKSATLTYQGKTYSFIEYKYGNGVFTLESTLQGNKPDLWTYNLIMSPYTRDTAWFELNFQNIYVRGHLKRIN